MAVSSRAVVCGLRLAFLLALGATGLVACAEEASDGRQSARIAPPIKPESRPTPWTTGLRPQRLALFVDASASMAAYSRTLGSTLHRLLTELHTSAGIQGITTFVAAPFGDTAAELAPIQGPTAVLQWPSAAATTCLPGPLETIATNAADVQSMYVILTDGVPSAAPVGGTCRCGDRVDVNCIAEQLDAIVRAGYGLWLIGVRSEFDGVYYSEMPPRGKLRVRKGIRPVYFWVMSRNIQTGRHMTRQIANKISTDTLAAEAWPGAWTGFDVAPITKAPQLTFNHAASCGNDSGQAHLQALETRHEPSGPVAHLALVSKGARAWWKMRLPHRFFSDNVEGLQTFTTMRGDRPRLASGGRVVWPAEAGDTSSGCLEILNGPLVWTTTWTATVTTERLADWSTADDSKLDQVERTLLLQELWTNIGRRVSGPDGSIEIQVAHATLQTQ